jgi:hypothetical protein
LLGLFRRLHRPSLASILQGRSAGEKGLVSIAGFLVVNEGLSLFVFIK